jgi:hypothetical protein
MIEITAISTQTPTPIPMIEASEMNETKRLACFARR